MAAPKKKPAKKSATKKPAANPQPSTKPVWQKLFIKPGCALMWNPPKGYTKWLKGSKAVAMDIYLVRLQAYDETGVENAWIFAKTLEDVDSAIYEIGSHLKAITNVIVSYKKGDKALHRDTLDAEMKKQGFTGVSLIAVDDTWSAMRFKRT